MENVKNRIGISGVAHFLPNSIVTSREIENLINGTSKEKVACGTIERITGVKKRHVAAKGEYNSTLAIQACLNLFAQGTTRPSDIDLLIFASTGQDILEPATAHIVQKEIGTQCPVMDVKNACNSFLNALEIAAAFLEIGKYKSILIASGEVPSKFGKLHSNSREELKRNFPAYVFGDAGTAVLVDTNAKLATIKNSYFFADSESWDVATFPGGGSRYLNDMGAYFFTGDGTKLVEPFFAHTKKQSEIFLKQNNISMADIDHFFVHQITVPYLQRLCKELQIPEEKIEVTIREYGNAAAASIPLAMSLKFSRAYPLPHTRGLIIGLAGGMSIGFMLLEF